MPERASKPGTTEAGYLVVLKLPPGMTPEDARAELHSSIGFGQAEVSLMYVMEDPPDAEKP